MDNVIKATGTWSQYAIDAQKKAAAEVCSKFDEPFGRSYVTRLDILAAQYDQLAETRTAQLEARAAQAEAEAKAIEAKARTSQVQMEFLQSSSWRITAPLRFIKVNLHRLNAAIRGG